MELILKVLDELKDNSFDNLTEIVIIKSQIDHFPALTAKKLQKVNLSEN
jgi:hypothetical protein